jgi:hypothetical protein
VRKKRKSIEIERDVDDIARRYGARDTHEYARETNRERLRATRDVVDAPGDDDARDDVVEGHGFWIAHRTVLILDAEMDPWDRVSWRPG